ncbi:FAD-binding protein [Janibacter cremeus]|uniref:FAD-dependent oxidoreductase n=1 Tax=Janibacter cremeus TaxID=1285192 RepID=UPI0023F70F0D|nr:FAD-binding protein [Janibacter cremeus]WEV77407.1 FAD-binding protein [Janibacter cremeus]
METVDVDVAVAGGGACGVMAALRTSENPDLVVAVFEKSTREGCNADVSSGSLAAGGTRLQREAGIEDSPQQHCDDIIANSGDEMLRPLVRALCEVAPRYVDWIGDTLGYPLEVGVDMPRKGMSVPRLHADPERRGGGPLMAFLRAELASRDNVAFVDEAPVRRLLTEPDPEHPRQQRVIGFVAEQNGEAIEVRATTTVVATDGFANNPDLMRRFASGLGTPFYGGVSTSTGDSIAWLEPLGAQWTHMEACLRHGQVTLGHGTRVNPALPWAGAVLMNTAGDRFVDEQAFGYSGLAGRIQAQPGERALMVWDEQAMAETITSEMMRDSLAAGAIREAEDVADLSRQVGIPYEALAEAMRPVAGRRPQQGRLHHTWLTHGVLTTQGGALIDPRCRVVRIDGSTVSGLRVGGGSAVGTAGPDSQGYSSGGGLMAAMGAGWIIGEELATGVTS